jgi:hypothetical protein
MKLSGAHASVLLGNTLTHLEAQHAPCASLEIVEGADKFAVRLDLPLQDRDDGAGKKHVDNLLKAMSNGGVTAGEFKPWDGNASYLAYANTFAAGDCNFSVAATRCFAPKDYPPLTTEQLDAARAVTALLADSTASAALGLSWSPIRMEFSDPITAELGTACETAEQCGALERWLTSRNPNCEVTSDAYAEAHRTFSVQLGSVGVSLTTIHLHENLYPY